MITAFYSAYPLHYPRGNSKRKGEVVDIRLRFDGREQIASGPKFQRKES